MENTTTVYAMAVENDVELKYDYVLNRIQHAKHMASTLNLEHISSISSYLQNTPEDILETDTKSPGGKRAFIHRGIRGYFKPTSIAILYEMFDAYMQYSYSHVKAIAQKYEKCDDPRVWKWIGIWLNILSVSECIEVIMIGDPYIPLEYMMYYKKAADLGSVEAAYGLAYDYYYSDNFDYTEQSFEYIHKLLDAGVTAIHLETIYLKTEIYCNEDEYDNAFPLYQTLIYRGHKKGIRGFMKNICNKHYRFLSEIKMHTRDCILRERLATTDSEITTFLAAKATGIHGDCPVCLECKPLIYHDCRQITHALCVMCYCKTAEKCPTCRFDFNAVKKMLIA